MAGWKQFILSGSSAEVTSVSLGTFNSDGTNGNISASAKIFASSSDPQGGQESGGLATTDVLIKLNTGEFAITSSEVFTTLYENPLSAGSGLASDDPYNGTTARRFTVDSSSLAGSGLQANANGIFVGAANNIDVATAQIDIDSGSLAGSVGEFTERGITSVPGDGIAAKKIGMKIGNGLIFTGGGLLQKNGPGNDEISASAALTDGAGIEDFTFNYNGDVTMNLDSGSLAGTMMTAKGPGGNANKLMIANTTSSLYLDAQPFRYIQKAKTSKNDAGVEAVIFEGSKLIYENISGDQLFLSGSTPTATDHNGTNVFGDFQVVGSSSFAHSSDFNVSEKFILVNSGSSPAATDDFGYTGQISATKAIFWAYTGSAAGGAFRFASGSANGGQLSDSNIFGTMRLHLGNTSGNPNSNAYSTFHKQSGHTIVDSGGTAVDSFYMYVE